MSLDVFISYSHKDEKFKETLCEHLFILKRQGLIKTTWNDRDILAGTDWSDEILTKLNTADVIILLVSSSFIASEFCFSTEVKLAIERHDRKDALVIPIIIRNCLWDETPFHKIQSVPTDGRAIASWENADDGWHDAIKGIKKAINSLLEKKEDEKKKEQYLTIEEKKPEFSELTKNWLKDICISLSHRAKDQLNLFDLFVPCDLKVNEYSASIEDDIEYISSKKLISEGHYLISGEEQQGKTSLLKFIFNEAGKISIPSLFLDSEKLKSDIDLTLKEEFELQYINYSFESFMEEPKKILLIDNINNTGLNNKYLSIVLCRLKNIFKHIIITCNDTYLYSYQDIPELSSFSVLDLLGMGHSKREELIEKWVSLGKEDSIDDKILYSTCDEFKLKLNSIIRKNIVPPKPVYVLILLQMFEAYSKQNLDLTSYGHCYQQLVYQSLTNAKVPISELGKYINVLTELAWEMHLNNGSIPSNSLNLFFDKYQKMYLSVDWNTIVSKLKSNSILIEKDNNLLFKYPYIFYFFTAKKIADSYSTDKDIEIEFKKLLSMLHKENYANILVFVTHHTKESWVLNEINNTLSCLFEDQDIATLSKEQLSFMSDFISKIPKLILETTKEVKEERKKASKHLDDIEKKETTKNSNEDESNEEEPDILVKINKTFKGMEVSGQIIRNRYAELTKGELLNLASNSSNTGLRFLNYFIELSDSLKKDIANLIKDSINIDPNITDEQLAKRSTIMFMQMTYSVINAVVRKIATSIGSKEATEIYKLLEENNNHSPSMILLNQAIDLEFRKSLNITTLKETVIKLKNNPVCLRILKEMVILHVYMFPVGYKEKQQISELLDLSTKSQRIMDSKKTGKG